MDDYLKLYVLVVNNIVWGEFIIETGLIQTDWWCGMINFFFFLNRGVHSVHIDLACFPLRNTIS